MTRSVNGLPVSVYARRAVADMIKEFTVSAKHTMNLGSYESMAVEASVTYSVNGDYEIARGEAQRTLEQLLSDSFYKQRSPSWFVHIAGKKAKMVSEQK